MSELFPTTSWSTVRRAADSDPQAWQSLVETYSRPIEMCFRRRLACRAPWIDADQVVRDFFTELFLKERLKVVDPKRGTFRQFVQHYGKWYLSEVLRNWFRHPPAQCVHKDSVLTEEDVFSCEEEAWMRGLLEEGVARLETEKPEWGEIVTLRHGLRAGTVEQKPAALEDLLGLSRKEVYRRYESAKQRLRQILLRLIRDSVAPGQHDAEYGGFNEWIRREFPGLASDLEGTS